MLAITFEMRITGGTARGQKLKLPRSQSLRPTTDRTREAIFSILISIRGHWSRGLDLYAGSGALGIEALSRQAEWVDFVDQAPRCCGIIKQNLQSTGFSQKASVYCCSVAKALSFLAGKYDLILMDPPYSDPSINDLVEQLADSKLVGDESLIVVCHTSRATLLHSYGTLTLVKERRHGDTCISIYHKEGKPWLSLFTRAALTP